MDPREIRIDTTPRSTPRRQQPPQWLVGVVGLVLVVGMLGGGAWWASTAMQRNASQVAADLEAQYEIQRNAGARNIDLGVRAGIIAEAYLQSQDPQQYRRWKAIADWHMREAGMPMGR